MLKINNLYKKYKDNEVLKDISLEIRQGEVVAIFGKSGCGKSTLLKCINKLEDIDLGQIYFEGKDIRKIDNVELRKKIGIVFQEYNLFEHLTVLDNLILGPVKINKIVKKTAIENAKKLLKKIGLEDKINNYPDELSGGQKQRVAIIRTLLMKPKLIMLDEPTSALDKEMKYEVLKLVKQLIKEGMTLIIVTHETEFVKRISDRTITLEKGKIKKQKI